MNYTLKHNDLSVSYIPETCDLTVTVPGSDITWSWSSKPFLVLKDGTSLVLTDGVCESKTYNTAYYNGVRATYSSLRDSEGNLTP